MMTWTGPEAGMPFKSDDSFGSVGSFGAFGSAGEHKADKSKTNEATLLICKKPF
jgi:hypothetical protein